MGKSEVNERRMERRLGRLCQRMYFLFPGILHGIDAVVSQFGFTKVALYRSICEHLEANNCLTDCVECFYQMTSELGDMYSNGHIAEWVELSGKMALLSRCLPCNQPFLLDFMQRLLSRSAAENDGSAELDATQETNTTMFTLLLKEWAKAKLLCGSWKDALLSAVGVNISLYSRTNRSIEVAFVRSLQFPERQSIEHCVNILKRSNALRMESRVPMK